MVGLDVGELDLPKFQNIRKPNIPCQSDHSRQRKFQIRLIIIFIIHSGRQAQNVGAWVNIIYVHVSLPIFGL